jgi:thioredoxin 1/thioredoxin 2
MNQDLPKSFNDLIQQSDLPVLVDFWAEWCGPCKMVSPLIKQIASEFKGRLLTVEVNVDQKPHIASQYQIQGIPTIMMFYKGKILMRLIGALPYKTLKAEIQINLN